MVFDWLWLHECDIHLSADALTWPRPKQRAKHSQPWTFSDLVRQSINSVQTFFLTTLYIYFHSGWHDAPCEYSGTSNARSAKNSCDIDTFDPSSEYLYDRRCSSRSRQPDRVQEFHCEHKSFMLSCLLLDIWICSSVSYQFTTRSWSCSSSAVAVA